MIEPWCWPPHIVADLTDAEISYIIRRQNEATERMQPDVQADNSAPDPKPVKSRVAADPEQVKDILEKLRDARSKKAKPK